MRRRMVAAPARSADGAPGRASPRAGLGDRVQRSLAHRIRWGNIARLAGALAVLALVVAWPRIAAPPPRLAGDEPVAVGGRDVDAVGRDEGSTDGARRREAKPRAGTQRRAATRPRRRAGTRPRRRAGTRPRRRAGT